MIPAALALLKGSVSTALLLALSCDASLAGLFTPPRPRMGRYDVCTSPDAIGSIAHEDWTIEAVPALEAFGTAGRYDRSALARVYAGKRAQVARGWVQHGDRFESWTLISPYPDATLTRLLPGTLVIRFVVRPGGAGL